MTLPLTALEQSLQDAAARKARALPREFTTERLLLRASTIDDLDETHLAAQETAEALSAWMPWAHPDVRRESMQQYFSKVSAEWEARTLLDFQVIESSTGRLVGKVGFHHIDWMLPRFEIGYWLRQSSQGTGYCTEAVRGLVAYAKEHLQPVRLEIRASTDNAASRAVAERAGFALEAIMRRNTWGPSGVRDACLYAMVF